MNLRTLTLAVAVLAAASGCSTVERSRTLGDPAVPAKTLALQVCSNCHGVGGHAISPNFPNLAGQQEQYFIAQLNAFKSHGRSDPAGFEYMWGLSRHLTDDQISGLAAYFSAQTPVPNAPGDAKLASEGKAIFHDGIPAKKIPACASCHGANGEGSGPFPRLADQHADYVIKQLQVFQRTDERPEGAVMKQVAHDLVPSEMVAVAAYVSSIPVH